MVPPNADRAAHAAPPQNSRLVVFTIIVRILYQIRGNRAAPMLCLLCVLCDWNHSACLTATG